MNVEMITRLLMIAGSCIAVVFCILLLMQRKKGAVLGKIIFVLGLIFMIAGNTAIYKFNNIINQHFATVKVDDMAEEDARAAAEEITQRIEEEGIVLLENKNEVLPLADKAVNVFGISSVQLTYGGAGSGSSDEGNNVTIQQGLENAGISVNDELTKFYEGKKGDKKKQNIFNLKGGDYNLKEPEVSEYDSKLIENAKKFSNTALVVFSRNGGEGGDLPMDMGSYKKGDAGKHYLELQDVELGMLNLVKENFDNVIIIINSSNAMELGFLEDEAIDGALWIGGPGATGCNALGRVLTGEVNPSGRLTDTYAYDLTTSPAYYNAGDFTYTSGGEDTKEKYVEYAEGIYVGYRYYETRYVDNATNKCDENAYAAVVQYPFGYGKSYTTFEQKIVDHKVDDGKISVDVQVKNIGKTPGKDVVQLYVTAPYTVGGIEKSFVELEGFGKTSELKPGASEVVSIAFDVEDMAAYDDVNNGCYVLEKGDYEVKLMANAHDLIDSFTYTVEDDVVYKGDVKRESDKVPAENLFDYAKGDVTYVSRADWEGTLPKERVEKKEVSTEFLDSLKPENIQSLYVNLSNDGEKITTGADNGLTLEDMVGVDFEDEKWDLLLDELTVEEMAKLIGYGGFSTTAVDSVGKVATIDIDGPAGLNALTSDISGVQYTSEVVIASTFNTGMVEEMGEVYAQEACSKGVVGLYAPGSNVHRTPFSGRNFEYYSEDPVLNGEMGKALATGFNNMGVYCYPKHFALNDQETNRIGVCVWSNEQAIREIYLKSFEIIHKAGVNHGAMTSYNRIGNVWCGGNKELVTDVLRGEWGFKGAVATDYVNSPIMSADQTLVAGGDLMLSTTGAKLTDAVLNTTEGQQKMRAAAKNILYMVVNSRAYTDPVEMGFPYWILVQIGVDLLIMLGMIIYLRKISKK